ncbi:hypothetical protein CANCADRAFT_783 [Tortispora caseinolytica NRRL Y-17796]|uniref:Endonuclease III homolog n=1 Tax=Tortispora caseinolytica NRRL Y-17796 TaxID=767744 RepID=A0A1E4TKB5_9ASCO|nr:hypothetical protein CANCADRAFT_783 [Tortispora caseinolytica NRRL Y-17796]
MKVPSRFYAQLDALRIIRQSIKGPVDYVGCHMLPDQTAEPKARRYQCLVSLMLSSQTKDAVTAGAMSSLREALATRNLIFSVDGVCKMTLEEIDECIAKVGFHTKKAHYILQTSRILREKYDGDIPESTEDLQKLPGVGPKMAYLCMQSAWGKVLGIGVDVHVHRLSRMLGWLDCDPVAKQKNTPEATRLCLEKWLPKELWSEINPLLVGFGQTMCPKKSPHCDQCLLAARHLCKNAKLRPQEADLHYINEKSQDPKQIEDIEDLVVKRELEDYSLPAKRVKLEHAT